MLGVKKKIILHQKSKIFQQSLLTNDKIESDER